MRRPINLHEGFGYLIVDGTYRVAIVSFLSWHPGSPRLSLCRGGQQVSKVKFCAFVYFAALDIVSHLRADISLSSRRPIGSLQMKQQNRKRWSERSENRDKEEWMFATWWWYLQCSRKSNTEGKRGKIMINTLKRSTLKPLVLNQRSRRGMTPRLLLW